MSATNCGWDRTFSLLRTHGFEPRHILDIGANHGHWTREAIRHFPQAEYLLVEPQWHLEACVQDLRQQGHSVRWIAAGVGDRAGVLPLTIAPNDCSSNFGMTPAAATAHGYQQTLVEVRTADEILATLGLPAPEMVKIDAEGFDLKVLAGGASFVGKADVIFIEAAVCAPGIENTMAAVLAKMADLGYRMIDIAEMNRSPKHGVLWLCELAFMREGCGLFDQIRSYR